MRAMRMRSMRVYSCVLRSCNKITSITLNIFGWYLLGSIFIAFTSFPFSLSIYFLIIIFYLRRIEIPIIILNLTCKPKLFLVVIPLRSFLKLRGVLKTIRQVSFRNFVLYSSFSSLFRGKDVEDCPVIVASGGNCLWYNSLLLCYAFINFVGVRIYSADEINGPFNSCNYYAQTSDILSSLFWNLSLTSTSILICWVQL